MANNDLEQTLWATAEARWERLVNALEEHMAVSVQLDTTIRENLGSLGW